MKDLSDKKVYSDIFEAVRTFAPNSPLIQLAGPNGRFFCRSNEYQIIDMGDHLAAFPGFATQLFRGENRIYDTSKASIYRSGDPDDVVVDELKILEFKNILLTFPQVQYAIEDHFKVDFLALAQHYELNTNLIDVTSAPEIAAYFATHRWVDGVAVPVEDGIGCIRGLVPLALYDPEHLADSKFHMIGLQCFERPGRQAAYGIEMNENDDLQHQGWCVYFRQTAKASRLIHTNFHINQEKLEKIRAEGVSRVVDPSEIEDVHSWLFPKEEIADIARCVKKSRKISRVAVDEYGRSCNEALERKGVEVVEDPVFRLSPARIIELQEQYKGRPYGDVSLRAHLTLRK